MSRVEIHNQLFPIQNEWQFPKYPGKTLALIGLTAKPFICDNLER